MHLRVGVLHRAELVCDSKSSAQRGFRPSALLCWPAKSLLFYKSRQTQVRDRFLCPAPGAFSSCRRPIAPSKEAGHERESAALRPFAASVSRRCFKTAPGDCTAGSAARSQRIEVMLFAVLVSAARPNFVSAAAQPPRCLSAKEAAWKRSRSTVSAPAPLRSESRARTAADARQLGL